MTRVLIVGMGNLLHQDDGFGVALAERLQAQQQVAGSPLAAPGVTIIEVGIGGMHLVQRLMDGYDLLIVLDSVDRGSAPGTVHLLEASVPALDDLPPEVREDFLADIHYAIPSRALILARALGVLPPQVYMLGCQPARIGDLAIGLSPVAAAAVEEGTQRIEALLRQRLAA